MENSISFLNLMLHSVTFLSQEQLVFQAKNLSLIRVVLSGFESIWVGMKVTLFKRSPKNLNDNYPSLTLFD